MLAKAITQDAHHEVCAYSSIHIYIYIYTYTPTCLLCMYIYIYTYICICRTSMAVVLFGIGFVPFEG